MDNKNCINCNAELSGDYCSSCGQKAGVNRITFKTLFQEYLGRFFGLDTKFLRTIKDLAISPGKVGRTFNEGNRVKHMGPVAFFFIITTLYLLSFSILGVSIEEFISSTSKDMQMVDNSAQSDQELALQQKIMEIISENIRIMSFLMVPFLGIVGKWFYRKSGLNFLEHTTNAFYMLGQGTLITILSVIIFKIAAYNPSFYVLFFSALYYMWATVRFYEKRGFWQWVKGLLFFIVSYALFLITFMIIVGLAVVGYVKFINPEFFG